MKKAKYKPAKCTICGKIFKENIKGRPAIYCPKCGREIMLEKTREKSKKRNDKIHKEAVDRAKKEKILCLEEKHKEGDYVTTRLLRDVIGMTLGETQTLTTREDLIRKKFKRIYMRLNDKYFQLADRAFLNINDIIQVLENRLKNNRLKRFYEFYKIYLDKLYKIKKIDVIRKKEFDKYRNQLRSKK